jgi:hypothetical protein
LLAEKRLNVSENLKKNENRDKNQILMKGKWQPSVIRDEFFFFLNDSNGEKKIEAETKLKTIVSISKYSTRNICHLYVFRDGLSWIMRQFFFPFHPRLRVLWKQKRERGSSSNNTLTKKQNLTACNLRNRVSESE